MNFNWFYLPVFQFLMRYRRTVLGPVWLLIGPSIFILLLGVLFSRVSSVDEKVLIPHLAIGIITWTLISGFFTESTSIFQRSRSQILQCGMSLNDIVLTTLQFAHQIILIFVVLMYFNVGFSLYSTLSLLGVVIIILNGYWVTIVFGFIGARYRDLSEVVQALMRILMLATPIIWIPSSEGAAGAVGPFLNFNPFYHFLEIVRAPLLNNPISSLTWMVVISITVIGFIMALLFFHRFHKQLPLWV